jgi:hypothetical protein
VERGIQSLEFLRDDLVRAADVIESQDKDVQAWLDENESKVRLRVELLVLPRDVLSQA